MQSFEKHTLLLPRSKSTHLNHLGCTKAFNFYQSLANNHIKHVDLAKTLSTLVNPLLVAISNIWTLQNTFNFYLSLRGSHTKHLELAKAPLIFLSLTSNHIKHLKLTKTLLTFLSLTSSHIKHLDHAKTLMTLVCPQEVAHQACRPC